MSIESYLGFAVKSGKIIYGIDNLKRSNKKKHLIILSRTAADNLSKKARLYSERYGVPLAEVDSLETLLKKENCKLAALLDENMAKAILKCLGGNNGAGKQTNEQISD